MFVSGARNTNESVSICINCSGVYNSEQWQTVETNRNVYSVRNCIFRRKLFGVFDCEFMEFPVFNVWIYVSLMFQAWGGRNEHLKLNCIVTFFVKVNR